MAMVDPGPQAAKMNQGTPGPWRVRGLSEQWREAPPQKVLGNSTTQGGTLEARTFKGHSGGAGSRGRSESAKLDRIHGEGELGGTSGDKGELGGTSGDEGELGGTGWRENSASSWDGAASGADSARSWDGAASGADSARSWDGAASGADSASSWDRGLWSGLCELLGRSGLGADSACSGTERPLERTLRAGTERPLDNQL